MADNRDDTNLKKLDGTVAVSILGNKELPPTPVTLQKLGVAEREHTQAQIAENKARNDLAEAQRLVALASQNLQRAHKLVNDAVQRDRRAAIDPATGMTRMAG